MIQYVRAIQPAVEAALFSQPHQLPGFRDGLNLNVILRIRLRAGCNQTRDARHERVALPALSLIHI